jgi:hypothetical protein
VEAGEQARTRLRGAPLQAVALQHVQHRERGARSGRVAAECVEVLQQRRETVRASDTNRL